MTYRKRILLIEDNAADAVLFRERMGESHNFFDLAVSRSLQEGLSAAAAGQFDVIFLDLTLPDSRGLDTVRAVTLALPALPVVVLTGMEDASLGLDSLRAGAQDYLVKGNISADSIARSARYAIERQRILLALQDAKDQLEEKVRVRTAELAAAVAQLQEQVRQREAAEEDRRHAERAVLDATEREQRRIGRDLHDSIQSALTGVGFMLTALKQHLLRSPGEVRELAAEIDGLSSGVSDTLNQARGLARGLCPSTLSGGGLSRALSELTGTIKALFRVDCRFEASGGVDLQDEALATQLYYVAQEAINNALKHAKASRISVRLQHHDDELSLCVQDDGSGIPSPFCSTTGMGLRTMHYRAKLIGASLTVALVTPRGTLVRCSLPCAGSQDPRLGS